MSAWSLLLCACRKQGHRETRRDPTHANSTHNSADMVSRWLTVHHFQSRRTTTESGSVLFREHMDRETGTIREVGFLQTSTKFVASSITHQKTVLVCSRNSTANVCSAFDVERAMCHQQQENTKLMTSKNTSGIKKKRRTVRHHSELGSSKQ